MNTRIGTLPPLTEARKFRLEHRVPLVSAALAAAIPSSRASIIERDPSVARPGELERLMAAVEGIAARRDNPGFSGALERVLESGR